MVERMIVDFPAMLGPAYAAAALHSQIPPCLAHGGKANCNLHWAGLMAKDKQVLAGLSQRQRHMMTLGGLAQLACNTAQHSTWHCLRPEACDGA